MGVQKFNFQTADSEERSKGSTWQCLEFEDFKAAFVSKQVPNLIVFSSEELLVFLGDEQFRLAVFKGSTAKFLRIVRLFSVISNYSDQAGWESQLEIRQETCWKKSKGRTSFSDIWLLLADWGFKMNSVSINCHHRRKTNAKTGQVQTLDSRET